MAVPDHDTSPQGHQVANLARRSRLDCVNRVRSKRVGRKLAQRKDLLNLPRVRLNDDQIRDGAALASHERQAQEQMPVNLVALDLDRKLALG